MKTIYLVDYWVPFPSSEYGGMISVIAKDDKECFDILSEFPQFDKSYDGLMMANIVKAPKFKLIDDEESRIVDAFLT